MGVGRQANVFYAKIVLKFGVNELTLLTYMLSTKIVLRKKTLHDDNATTTYHAATTDHADAANGALQSAQQKSCWHPQVLHSKWCSSCNTNQ